MMLNTFYYHFHKRCGESMSTLLGYRKDTNVGSSLTATVYHEKTFSKVVVELTIVDDKGKISSN